MAPKYAWYSKEQAKLIGELVYQDENGNNVVVTQITPGSDHCTGFDDIESRGLVETTLRCKHLSLGTANIDSPIARAMMKNFN